jgi:hypothetical protein
MGKKRSTSCKKAQIRNRRFLVVPRSRSAQITIFMIVGIVILFTFIFLFQVVNSAQKEKLISEQEKVFTKAFKKEAMRIYVEDCLSDELEEALIILGQQGRVWLDQPGGVKQFSEGINGVEYPPGSGNRLSYGLAKTQNLQFENSYPCHNKIKSFPEFCQYKFPENSEGFGERNLKSSTIENDLRRYLINRTMDCIINYTKTNISNKADVEVKELKLGLHVENDGININADFPLKFSLGKEEFFHLSQFDFFYPTQFKWLLEVAVVRPLFYDWRYLDFNYTEETLQQQTFNYASNSPECVNGICTGNLFYDKYSSLGITMQKEENENGDDIFIFSSPEVINRPEPYEFKVARQNRPPALDYINRSQCLSAKYDYLVIPDDEEFGDINITLFALDPDEDNVTLGYNFECGNSASTVNSLVIDGYESSESPISEFEEENQFKLSKEDLSGSPPLKCTLTSIAADEHGEPDWQETRILIDRPITLNISLDLPYTNVSSQHLDYYYVSREDPIYVNIVWPIESLTVGVDDTRVNLTYTSLEGAEDFSEVISSLATIQVGSCFNFPWLGFRTCNIDDYIPDLKNWETYFDRPFSYFKNLTEKGLLNLTFAADYCSDLTKEESVSANIVVKECVPLRNENHPFSFPYEKFEFDSYDFANDKGDYTGDSDINPFLATHSCCKGNINQPASWRLKQPEEICFINPEPGCYGGQGGSTALGDNGHYVLEVEMNTCSGERGNICDGAPKHELFPLKEENKMYCGYNGKGGCSGIKTPCQGNESWWFVDTDDDYANDGWCNGKMGCSNFCETEVVSDYEMSDYYNYRLKKIFEEDATENQNFNMHCKCKSNDDDKPCDADFDGYFEGACEDGVCVVGGTVDVVEPPATFCIAGKKYCLKDLTLDDFNLDVYEGSQNIDFLIDTLKPQNPEFRLRCNEGGTDLDPSTNANEDCATSSTASNKVCNEGKCE